jgi:large subunit ribosomal protein L4
MSTLLRPISPVSRDEEQLVELDPYIFHHPIRRDILHLCAIHHLDGLRQGTASTKTRGEVRGSGRKIRPQKGSGRARLGDAQSPMLRGGGVAFGPKPRDFSTKLPRKVIDMGMRVALSARVRERAFEVVETLDWPSPKTQDLVTRLAELGWGKTLFITGSDEVPVSLDRASGNIRNVDTMTAEESSVYDVLKWPRLVLDLAAVQWFEQSLGRKQSVQ